MLTIFDADGQERDAAWLESRYGAVNVRTSTAESGFRAVELRESIGPAVYVVKVLDEFGDPMDQEIVARHWPYREENYELETLPENEWFTRGVYGPTNANGDIGFGTGGGDYYHPENGQQGATSLWVLEYPSDCVEGIGTLGGTEHAHLDVTFAWVEGDEEPPPPPPPPPDPDIEKVRALIVQAQGLLDQALGLLG